MAEHWRCGLAERLQQSSGKSGPQTALGMSWDANGDANKLMNMPLHLRRREVRYDPDAIRGT